MALAAALGLSLLFTTGCNTETAPIKKVASIDESQIYEMEIFTKADEEVKAWADAEGPKREKAVADKSDEEKAAAYREFQMELEKKSNETLNPLKEKARAAVASAAAKKGVTVVLDEKIIVYGVPDITEDVKTLLSSGQEITYPEDSTAEQAQAPIGYFDQDIVRNLKVFKEAEVEVLQERGRLINSMREKLQEAEEAGNRPSPAELQAMQKSIETRLGALQEQKLAPLVKAVSDSVEEVAKKEGLSLVLDTQHVMYGGRNLTENVVDTFLKKISDKSSGGTEPAASPTPSTVE
jgi:outer membrane protein